MPPAAPASPRARRVALREAIIGWVFLALALTAVVALLLFPITWQSLLRAAIGGVLGLIGLGCLVGTPGDPPPPK